MYFFTDDSPIIACSTGLNSNTALAIIRLSGFDSLLGLQSFFKISLAKVIPRYSHLTDLIFDNKIFDNVVIVFFPKGKSFNGENILEISAHGNLLNIQNILSLFINHGGFRMAHPGEFTYRALKNKKLSLLQVEGLDLLLNANSNLMLGQGLDVLQGNLYSQYKLLYEKFLKLKATVELSIDFSDDIGELESKKLFQDSFLDFMKVLELLHSRTLGNIASLLSPEVVLVGQTNAGKSSLFNLLLKHGRSIVSEIPGTTRDYVSETIWVDETLYNLVDTAGIREADDPVEKIGIDRSFEVLNRAFFKILIVNPFFNNQSYLNKFVDVEFDLIIISHADVVGFALKLKELNFSDLKYSHIVTASFKTGSIGPSLDDIGPIEPELKNFGPIEPKLKKLGPIEPEPKELGPIEPELKKLGPIEPEPKNFGPIEPVIEFFLKNKFKKETENSPLLIERHRLCINKIHLHGTELFKRTESINDAAVLSSEINIFEIYLSELIGKVPVDQVLNSIFSNFCIGK